jgi:type IV fimbrial biogenesis protein FimT
MPQRQAGVSLIESATVTAVAALLVGTALPSFEEMRQRQQLRGVAAQLETDMQLARSEAVARSEPVRLSLAQDGAGGACWWLHTGAKPDASCAQRPDALRQVRLDAGQPVRLQANSRSLLFDPVKGTVTPTGTIKLQSSAGAVHLVINVMGRIRSCSPDSKLSGLPRC